jgi:glucose-6-phosphate isomerase
MAMAELSLDGLFGVDAGFAPELFERFAPTLEGLRHVLLAQAREPSHPFFHLPPPDPVVEEVRVTARELRRMAQRLVVAGIGGSALGAKALCAGGNEVAFLEGVDPRSVQRTLRSVDWRKAALNIVSKSGGTLETLVNAGLALEALKKAHPVEWRRRVVATCSPVDGRLQRWAASEGIKVLQIPQPVGGRYSVLSPVGLLPSAFQGTDPSVLVAGARSGADKALLAAGAKNPALAFALALVSFFAAGRTEVVLWGYGEKAYAFALWAQQLLGESLGRRITASGAERRVGATPLCCRGSEDQHSLLQLFVDGPLVRWVLLLTGEEPGPALSPKTRAFAGLPDRVVQLGQVQEALWKGTQRGLREAGVPVGRYDLGSADAFSLAESFYVFMAATIYAAALLEVDPFGQPGVEAGKHHTRDILAAGR